MTHILGGFKIHVLQKDEIPNVQGVFDKGAHVEGVTSKLMLFLGRQLVNGYNYAYIARSQADAKDSVPYYELVIINYIAYTEEKKISLVKRETIVEGVPKGIMGGMMCSSEEEAFIRRNSRSEQFDYLLDLFEETINKTKEMKEETEIVKKVKEFDYEPKLYLGQKSAKGANYYYITEATNLETERKSIQLVVINNFIEGSEVTKVEKIL